MEELLKDFSERAKTGLRKIQENDAKLHLEELIKFTVLRGSA